MFQVRKSSANHPAMESFGTKKRGPEIKAPRVPKSIPPRQVQNTAAFVAQIDAARRVISFPFSAAASNDPQDTCGCFARRRPESVLYQMLPSLTPITVPGGVPSG
jgi:hypothetical protein